MPISVRSSALLLMLCADGVQAATFTVTSTSDAADAVLDGNCVTAAGGCSLRAALMEANSTPAADAIHFNIPGGDAGCSGSGTCTIMVVAAAPQDVLEATQPVMIDGSTQPGNAAVCASDIPNRPAYRVVLQGGGQEPGLRLAGDANNSTIRGLNLRGFNGALVVVDVTGAAIECNFIGTTETGTNSSVANIGNGVLIACSAQSVAIGGISDTQGNLISDHEIDGVQIVGDGCAPAQPNQISVQGNFIGTDKTGLADLGNGFAGLSVFGATTAGMGSLFIGNAPSGANAGLNGNVISGNDSAGIYIAGEVDGVFVQGNLIGTNLTGSAALPNAFDGIFIEDYQCDGSDVPVNVLIGSMTTPALGNVLSGNLGDGIYAYCMPGSVDIGGNTIGLSQDLTTPLPNRAGITLEYSNGVQVGGVSAPNTISGNTAQGVAIFGSSSSGNEVVSNSIHDNGALGIDLGSDSGPDGRTPNDTGDGDSGPNTLLNTPVLVSRSLNAGQVSFTFTVNTDFGNNPAMQVNFYRADSSGEEGRSFINSMTVTGNGMHTSPAFPAPAATATTPFVSTLFALTTSDTSEFSLPIPEVIPLFASGFE